MKLSVIRNVIKVLFLAVALAGASAHADLSPSLKAKIEVNKKKLIEWAKNPVLIRAIEENQPLAGMTLIDWANLSDKDPIVRVFETSESGKLMYTWTKENPDIGKLYLRDAKGNLVAANDKPLFYNNSKNPVFINTIGGKPWNAKEVKPDTTTQVPGVHLAVPVFSGKTVIGLLHTTVIAK